MQHTRGHAIPGPYASTATQKPGEYRAYLSTPDGIKSYYSAADPWTTWTEEPGYHLQVDSTTGPESCEVAVPTVLRLGPGNYLMVYLSGRSYLPMKHEVKKQTFSKGE